MDCEHKFTEVFGGDTIKNQHIIVFQCDRCGKLDYKVEKIE